MPPRISRNGVTRGQALFAHDRSLRISSTRRLPCRCARHAPTRDEATSSDATSWRRCMSRVWLGTLAPGYRCSPRHSRSITPMRSTEGQTLARMPCMINICAYNHIYIYIYIHTYIHLGCFPGKQSSEDKMILMQVAAGMVRKPEHARITL